jgi:eukaryotic-like serine/threonine-protein kinase
VAVREGLQAYLEGEVSRLGAGYVLTANLRDAETERSLASFRETAKGDDDLIASLETLSRRIRERAGESLRSIHAGPGLERVTTSSLPALRLYTESLQPFNRGDYAAAIRLLEEAVALDPDFAMAWRRLSVAWGNQELDRVREREAAEEAYRLRHRLSDRERLLTEARYHRSVTRDEEAQKEAYERVLRIDPYDPHALNNLGLIYTRVGDWDAAEELYQRNVNRPGTPHAVAFRNLIRTRIRRGRVDEALEAVERFAEVHPESMLMFEDVFWVHFIRGDEESARVQVERLLTEAGHNLQARIVGHDLAGRLALWRGRLADAREHLAESEAAAREVGPSAHLIWRLFRTQGEVVVGQNERALALLSEAEWEGMFTALPPSDQWHFFHANLLGMAGRPDEAEAVLRRFEEDVPEEFHDRFHYLNESARFFVALHRGDSEGAIGILEYIQTTEPCRLCFAERMGWALREAGRLEEAAEEWEAALAWRDLRHAMNWQLGQNIWIMQRIGSLYEELGDTERALHHYRRLIELWADADPELQPAVERARERIGALESEGG